MAEVTTDVVKKRWLTLGRGDSYNITFFYVSDIIDVIMSGIEKSFETKQAQIAGLKKPTSKMSSSEWESLKTAKKDEIKRKSEQFKKFRLVLGPIEIVNPKNPSESKSISLGDVPISTKYFNEWMAKKIEKEEDMIFSLASFINQFLGDLISDVLNTDECFNGQIKQSTLLYHTTVTAYKKSAEGYDDLTDKILNESYGSYRYNIDNYEHLKESLLRISGDPESPGGRPATDPLGREIHYLIYYAGRSQPKEKIHGNKTEDQERGVFHYGIGKPEGIVKTINFQRNSVPSLKMVRFEQEGYDGLQQLREQYDAIIKTYANVKAMPGCYIYVEPDTFAPGTIGTEIDLTSLGIGGYYMITKSEHRFAPGVAESSITGKWVHSKDMEFTTSGNKGKVNKESGERPKGKCSVTRA